MTVRRLARRSARYSATVHLCVDVRRSFARVPLIESRILVIRGHKVMLDADLAVLYELPTKQLNEAVSRNKERFPADFMFRLNSEEEESLKSQIATSNEGRGGRRNLPLRFH